MARKPKPHPLPYISETASKADRRQAIGDAMILTPHLLPFALTRLALKGGRKFRVMQLDELKLVELARRLTDHRTPRSEVFAWYESLGMGKAASSSLYRFADALVDACEDVMHAMHHPHLNDPDVLTEAEAADRLKVRRSAVRALVDAGELRGLWIGGELRIATSSFRAYVDGDNAATNAVQTADEPPADG